jgi:hypothetical protein
LAGESSKFFTVTVTMPSDGSFRTVKPVSSRLPMVGAAPELVAAAGAGEWDGPATATAPAAATKANAAAAGTARRRTDSACARRVIPSRPRSMCSPLNDPATPLYAPAALVGLHG